MLEIIKNIVHDALTFEVPLWLVMVWVPFVYVLPENIVSWIAVVAFAWLLWALFHGLKIGKWAKK